jgi:hypothetical protein
LGTNRTLVESSTYRQQFTQIAEGKPARLDDVLTGLTWSISERPESWPLIPGYRTTRLAKSDGYGDTAKLRIWFRIVDENQIELRYIELYE